MGDGESFIEKARTVSMGGRSAQLPPTRIEDGNKVVPVEHEHGGVAGEQIHHSDGRVDAKVFARSVKVSTNGTT